MGVCVCVSVSVSVSGCECEWVHVCECRIAPFSRHTIFADWRFSKNLAETTFHGPRIALYANALAPIRYSNIS